MAYNPRQALRRDLVQSGPAWCDHCRKRRPQLWARLTWHVLGGIAGYYDFCSARCEQAHVEPARVTGEDIRYAVRRGWLPSVRSAPPEET